MGWSGGSEQNPGKTVFRPDRDLRSIALRFIERANCHIQPLRAAVIGEKERRPAASREGAKPARMPNISQFTRKKFDARSPDFAPGHERRRAGATTIDAMAIAELPRRLLQLVADTAAEAASFDFRFHPAFPCREISICLRRDPIPTLIARPPAAISKKRSRVTCIRPGRLASVMHTALQNELYPGFSGARLDGHVEVCAGDDEGQADRSSE